MEALSLEYLPCSSTCTFLKESSAVRNADAQAVVWWRVAGSLQNQGQLESRSLPAESRGLSFLFLIWSHQHLCMFRPVRHGSLAGFTLKSNNIRVLAVCDVNYREAQSQ